MTSFNFTIPLNQALPYLKLRKQAFLRSANRKRVMRSGLSTVGPFHISVRAKTSS